jgi:hypothetical protein|tara:strand:+ start:1626 stop:1862 length:237 start_codon:yes stop_codon:yes gene_type:complete
MVNLIYIRAAILQATGVSLSLERVKEYLIEEGLITLKQSQEDDLIFRGYDEFFGYDVATTTIEKVDHYISKDTKDEDE